MNNICPGSISTGVWVKYPTITVVDLGGMAKNMGTVVGESPPTTSKKTKGFNSAMLALSSASKVGESCRMTCWTPYYSLRFFACSSFLTTLID